jgi:hypothetical protein
MTHCRNVRASKEPSRPALRAEAAWPIGDRGKGATSANKVRWGEGMGKIGMTNSKPVRLRDEPLCGKGTNDKGMVRWRGWPKSKCEWEREIRVFEIQTLRSRVQLRRSEAVAPIKLSNVNCTIGLGGCCAFLMEVTVFVRVEPENPVLLCAQMCTLSAQEGEV